MLRVVFEYTSKTRLNDKFKNLESMCPILTILTSVLDLFTCAGQSCHQPAKVTRRAEASFGLPVPLT